MRLVNYFLVFLFIVSFLNSGCKGCSKSGRKQQISENDINPETKSERPVKSRGKIVVKMKKNNGVYEIPVEIDGIPMSFIFDTGAGIISISATEATFLYKQGKLKDEDFLGTNQFIDANGDISEGTIINLKSVKIGTKELNDVEASVVHNLVAPLLMGQSALERFGKISIDYQKEEITFE